MLAGKKAMPVNLWKGHLISIDYQSSVRKSNNCQTPWWWLEPRGEALGRAPKQLISGGWQSQTGPHGPDPSSQSCWDTPEMKSMPLSTAPSCLVVAARAAWYGRLPPRERGHRDPTRAPASPLCYFTTRRKTRALGRKTGMLRTKKKVKIIPNPITQRMSMGIPSHKFIHASSYTDKCVSMGF